MIRVESAPDGDHEVGPDGENKANLPRPHPPDGIGVLALANAAGDKNHADRMETTLEG